MLGTGTRPSPRAIGAQWAGPVLGIIAVDDRGLVTRFSAGLGELGLDASPQRLGRHWTELFPSFRRLPMGGGGEDDFVAVLEDTRQAFRVTQVPGGGGEKGGAFLLLRAFEQPEEEGGDAFQLSTLSELAAGVAHEINNPLTTISGWMQIFVSEAGEGDPVREQLASIQEELDRIARIVDKLVAFAQRPSAEREVLDANELLRSVVSFLEYQMLNANVRMTTDLSPQVRAVEGNASELKQVFLNLMLNARQAMPEGGTLRVATAAGEGGRWVEARFEDSGHGVPEEARERLFEPYFTTRAEEGGTGLGLAVSREIVRKMGGELELESTSPRGSTFLVRLPVSGEA
ncbi:MAG: sensor histidine kinase [Candidatus Brocadiia bacterium]